MPARFEGRAPDRVDSGRNCTTGSLGTLASHGVTELRYAGGVWETGPSSGISHAVFEADGLESAWVAEFYEAGARTGRRVEALTRSAFEVGRLVGQRIDVLNGESYQTVLVLPRAPGQVAVVLVASFIRTIQTRHAHEQVVQRAIDGLLAPSAATGRPEPSGPRHILTAAGGRPSRG